MLHQFVKAVPSLRIAWSLVIAFFVSSRTMRRALDLTALIARLWHTPGVHQTGRSIYQPIRAFDRLQRVGERAY
jgi:hypothetical protein